MSSPHDFGFFHGAGDVRHRRRTDFLDPGGTWTEFRGTSLCRPLFDGAANVGEIDMPRLSAKGATLQVSPRSTGNACSRRADVAETPDQTNRTRTSLPSSP
jgi:hypothetical protein